MSWSAPRRRARGLTVVTNSLDAAIVLSRASRLEVYNIGGTVSPVTRAQEGDWAVHEMERLHVDVSVVCPAGISVERGLTQATPAAAAVSQVEVASGERVIALADRDSFGVSAFVQFASLEQIDSDSRRRLAQSGRLAAILGTRHHHHRRRDLMTLVAGVDSSTQSVKIVVCDVETGTVVRSARASHPSGTEVPASAWLAAYQEATADPALLDGVCRAGRRRPATRHGDPRRGWRARPRCPACGTTTGLPRTPKT